jgi:hypothetical protein
MSTSSEAFFRDQRPAFPLPAAKRDLLVRLLRPSPFQHRGPGPGPGEPLAHRGMLPASATPASATTSDEATRSPWHPCACAWVSCPLSVEDLAGRVVAQVVEQLRLQPGQAAAADGAPQTVLNPETESSTPSDWSGSETSRSPAAEPDRWPSGPWPGR